MSRKRSRSTPKARGYTVVDGKLYWEITRQNGYDFKLFPVRVEVKRKDGGPYR